MVAICVLSPISAKKNPTKVVVNAPERLIALASLSYLSGEQRPHPDAQKRKPEIPPYPRARKQAFEKRPGKPRRRVVSKGGKQDAENNRHRRLKTSGKHEQQDLRLVPNHGTDGVLSEAGCGQLSKNPPIISHHEST
jgi:hypothetical protein